MRAARYQEVYPSAPLVRSTGAVRPTAASLLTLEYFEAPPAEMPTQVYAQHHVLLNLRDEPHEVENTRDGVPRRFQFARDEIVVTPAGVRSGWRWFSTSRVIVITLEPDALEQFALHELGLVLTSSQLTNAPQFHDPDLCHAGALLLDALRQRAIGSDVMFESLARVFLIKLLQRYGAQRDAITAAHASFTAEHYKRVLDHLASHLDRTIPVEELAAVAGMSTQYFTRLFKQTIGQSPHQFVMSYRVEQARKLLASPRITLSDVALRCGFADQSHLTRMFKRETGLTPREYRLELSASS
jgi:AraC family transcriptional regulator